MQLRNKLFPYPVIIAGGNYYENSSFVSNVKQQFDGYNVKLKLSVTLDNSEMEEYIKKGSAIYAHHIECPQTCFRKIIKTKSADIECILKDTDVCGIVEICSFVIANEDIEKYTNKSFSSLYRGWKYDIEKGCILAVGNQYNLTINKQRDDLANTSSIFSVIPNSNQAEPYISYNINSQKIIIMMPQITFNQYANIQDYIDIQPVIHAMIIVPALSYALSELINSADHLYEYEDYRWFKGLKKACKKLGIELNEETIKLVDIIKLPQQLLDSPITKAIEYCALGGGTYED